MMLQQVFSAQGIILNLQSNDKDELFEEMLETAVSIQPDINREEALLALRDRENRMSTGILHSVAVPHCRLDTVKEVVGVLGISQKGIDFESLDNSPVHFVFMLLCNGTVDNLHLKILKTLAFALQDPRFIKELSEKKSAEEVYNFLGEWDS